MLSCVAIDWLISRRHCDNKWHVQSKAIRNRVVQATKDLPQEDEKLAKILEDNDSTYIIMCDIAWREIFRPESQADYDFH